MDLELTDQEREEYRIQMEGTPEEKTELEQAGRKEEEVETTEEPEQPTEEPIKEPVESTQEPVVETTEEPVVESTEEEDAFAGMKIPISVTNEEGEAVIEEIPYDQLVQEHNAFIAIKEQSEADKNYVSQASPIIEAFNKSKVLQDALMYLKQGYNDEQVKQGLMQFWSDAKTEPGEDDSQTDYNKDMAELNNRMLRAEKIAGQQADQLKKQQVWNENEAVLQKAVRKYGLDPKQVETDPEFQQKLNSSFTQFYGNMDLTMEVLNQNQANGIINHALNVIGNTTHADARKQTAELVRAKSIVKKTQAPTILQGRTATNRDGSGGTQEKEKQWPASGVPMAERVRRWEEI
ncbi:hypothetical protein LCGC14_0341980 [marine sediment metagenome]|uniref:Scaffolding protein n=1 Tax=marine sediment metagenome TaxID=412755 RepID=A0A0F9W0I9_9ZZZZ